MPGLGSGGSGGSGASVRGAVLEAVGQPVVIADLELIEPRAGEVRVRVLESGVCHSDLHVRDGEWERPTPIVMGHEGAGIVEIGGASCRERGETSVGGVALGSTGRQGREG